MFNDINVEENTNWEFSTFDSENIYNEETPQISNTYNPIMYFRNILE